MENSVNVLIPNNSGFKMLMWSYLESPDMPEEYKQIFLHFAEKDNFEIVHILGVMDYISDYPIGKSEGMNTEFLITSLELVIQTLATQYRISFMAAMREFADQRVNLRSQINTVLSEKKELPSKLAVQEKLAFYEQETKNSILSKLKDMGIDADNFMAKLGLSDLGSGLGTDPSLDAWAKIDKTKLN